MPNTSSGEKEKHIEATMPDVSRLIECTVLIQVTNVNRPTKQDDSRGLAFEEGI